MFAMTSRCFDGPLECAVTAPSLSKPNPAWAVVSQGSPSAPAGWFLQGLCLHKPPSPALIFHRKDTRGCGRAQSRELSSNVSRAGTAFKAAARAVATDAAGARGVQEPPEPLS